LAHKVKMGRVSDILAYQLTEDTKRWKLRDREWTLEEKARYISWMEDRFGHKVECDHNFSVVDEIMHMPKE
jgi:hypothetical protein